MATDSKTKLGKEEAENIDAGARTASVASLAVFGRFSSIIFTGIAFIIVARILGPGVYGIYTLAVAFAGFFGGIADLGVNTAINKFIGEYLAKKDHEKLSELMSNGYLSVFLSGMAFTLFGILISGFVATHVLGNVAYTSLIEVTSFCIVGAMLQTLSFNSTIAFGKGRYAALVLILQTMAQAIISITLVLMGFGAFGPILGLLFGYFVSILFTVLVLIYKYSIKFRMPSLTYIKKFLGFSSPISIYNGLRGLSNNLSPIILEIFATTVIVGNFGVAVRASNVILVATDTLGIALLPMLAYAGTREDLGKSLSKFYNYASYITFVLIVPLLLYVAILSKQVSFTVFSSKYVFAPTYLSIMAIGTLLWILATYTYMLLVSANKVKELFKFSIIISCIELPLLFIMTYFFGAIGLLALMFIITPSMIALMFGVFARNSLKVSLNVGKLLRVIVAGLISALFLIPLIVFLPNSYIPVLIIGFVSQLAIYPIIIVFTGAANSEDIKTIKTVTDKLPVMNVIVRKFASYSEFFMKNKTA